MKTHSVSARPKHGFTLIELLAVIAIVGILAAIIFPVIGKVRQTASKATMTSNLRQLGEAMMLFSADNHGRLPGLYVPGTDAGGLNASFALTTGQSSYATYSGTGTEPRANLQSIDQLGRYITRSTVTVDGQTKLYCPLLESPAFASQRPVGVYPTSVELASTIMSSDGSLLYPFGNKNSGLMSISSTLLASSTNPSKRWMLIEVDKTTPSTVDPTITSAGWYSALPDKPVHGNGWLTAFFDGHVEMLNPGDARLNNKTAL